MRLPELDTSLEFGSGKEFMVLVASMVEPESDELEERELGTMLGFDIISETEVLAEFSGYSFILDMLESVVPWETESPS